MVVRAGDGCGLCKCLFLAASLSTAHTLLMYIRVSRVKDIRTQGRARSMSDSTMPIKTKFLHCSLSAYREL
jgi:hypothetical protein